MAHFLQVLRDRGFIQQTTDDATAEKPLARLLETERVTGYIGFDPSATSLHAGSLVPIMALVHLQRCGHRPIVVLGGGTGMVGDPSGKTEMRQVLIAEQIAANLGSQRAQFTRYLDLAGAGDPQSAGAASNTGLILDNGEWLQPLNYIEFLREIGRHFSINRMLAQESVKLRLESEGGLSFLEFNYSLLQAYDFLVLYRRFGCKLQMGGSDQWGNIVSGVDLIRRVEGGKVHGLTFPLLTTAGGRKMGKTEASAVWLDAARTSPYDYYQFWINADDRDVGRFLRLFTLLSLEEIESLEKLAGAELRRAKEALAFEATVLTHGREEAEKARQTARALFVVNPATAVSNSVALDPVALAIPTFKLLRQSLEQGIPAVKVFAECGLCESRNAARRLAEQKGLYVNGQAIEKERLLTMSDLMDGAILLRAGKKKHMRVILT